MCEVQVEIWPTCVVLPAGYGLVLRFEGRDFERVPADDANDAWRSRGSGPFLHAQTTDRPASLFSGSTTIHTGGQQASYLLLPIIP